LRKNCKAGKLAPSRFGAGVAVGLKPAVKRLASRRAPVRGRLGRDRVPGESD
jgi:hypothetical protein